MGFLEEALDLPEFIKLFVGLIAIANPLAAVPIVATFTGRDTQSKQHRKLILMAILTFVITLVVFAYIGESLLAFLGISIESFMIAGGILLLLTAIQMMSTKPGFTPESEEDEPMETAVLGIVPIGIPILAGPGAISTIIIYAHRTETLEHNLLVTLVILAVAVLILAVLLTAPLLGRLLGKTGLFVFNRVMGLIIAAIGIEFVIHGLGTHFPGLTG